MGHVIMPHPYSIKVVANHYSSIFLGRWPCLAAIRVSIQFHMVSYCSAIKRRRFSSKVSFPEPTICLQQTSNSRY